MDVIRALRFPWDDRDWIVKFMIGALVSLIPAAWPGYQIYTARRIIRQQDERLPSNDETGRILSEGLIATIAWLVYFTPVILVLCVFTVPIFVVGNNDLGFALVSIALSCAALFAIAYSIPASALYWMGVIRYVETGRPDEFIRIPALSGAILDHLGTLLSLWVYTATLALFVLVLAPFLALTVIGLPLLAFYFHNVTGHLIGQAGITIISRERS
ncbi:MAG: DUF4013 domain-containing protein [Anaerolineae bacterium]|nr:DUF4013 domain-containing protein [Anaerolineae bacterium]